MIRDMKKLGLAATTLALALTGCTSNDADTADETPTLDSIEAVDTHIADTYGGSAELNDGDLSVTLNSRGTELQDQDATLKAIQDIGTATGLDYTTATITLTADSGAGCGHRYDADTVSEIAGADTAEVVVTDIWDHAEASTPCNY